MSDHLTPDKSHARSSAEPEEGDMASQNPHATFRTYLESMKERHAQALESSEHVMREGYRNAPLVPQIIDHLIVSGGKRLRALLVLQSASMVGLCVDDVRVHALSACVEAVHAATLLHDDVVDESPARRGRPAAQTLWGNALCVLAGDYLLSCAFGWMVGARSLDVMDMLAKASQQISSGEIIQLGIAGSWSPSEEIYLDVIERKTASLFEAACAAPILLIEGSSAQIADRSRAPLWQKGMAGYGRNLGIAFQLMDDLLDYQGAEGLGKTTCQDFFEGKLTYPLLTILPALDEDNLSWLKGLFENPSIVQARDQRRDAADKIVALVRERGGFDKTQHAAKDYVNKALESLSVCPEGPDKDLFVLLAKSSVERLH